MHHVEKRDARKPGRLDPLPPEGIRLMLASGSGQTVASGESVDHS